MNGMEITQFTYFQQVGGLDCKPITGEITYGLERLAMYLQGVENVYDLVWTEWKELGRDAPPHLSRRVPPERGRAVDVQLRALRRRRRSSATSPTTRRRAKRLMEAQLALPAYEQVLKAAHTFNLLDARGAISVTERAAYIGRIRNARAGGRAELLRIARAPRLPDAAAEGRCMSTPPLAGRAAVRGAAAQGARDAWATPSPTAFATGLAKRGLLADEPATRSRSPRRAASPSGITHVTRGLGVAARSR